MTADEDLDEQIIILAAAGHGRPAICGATGAGDWTVRGRLEDPAVREAIAECRLDIREKTNGSNVYYKWRTRDIVYAALRSATNVNDLCKLAKIILHAPEVPMPDQPSKRSRPTRARLEDLEATPTAKPLESLEDLEATPTVKPLESLEELEATPAFKPLDAHSGREVERGRRADNLIEKECRNAGNGSILRRSLARFGEVIDSVPAPDPASDRSASRRRGRQTATGHRRGPTGPRS